MFGFRAVSVCFGLPLIAVCSLEAFHPAQGQTPDAHQRLASPTLQADAISPQGAVLNRYCVTCHNDRLKTAGLALDKLDVNEVGADASVWEKVVQKLRSGAMPPAGRPRPDKTTYDSLVASLETSLDRAAEANPNPGRAPVHRLNRAEYTNAVRDLLGVEVDGRSLLPPDESGYGFDNIADVLSVSPALLDRYMIAAEKISRLAIGDPSMRPETQKYTVPYTLWQDDRMSEELPFGSRGGIAVRHHFPLDGEYQIKVVLQRAYQNPIRGLRERDDLEVRLDRQRIKLFTVGGDGPISRWAAVVRPSLYEQTADQGLEVRVHVKAGTRLVGAAFLEKSSVREGVLDPRPGVSSLAFARDRTAPMAVDSVQITGPYDGRMSDDTPSRRRIFVCYPAASHEEKACARKIVSTLARRAYRRPVTDIDVEPLLKLYDAGRAKGGFDEGIEFASRGILIDPEFLFRIERDPANAAPGTVYRLSDIELATRLSFFLWSTIPDEELLGLAERGKLKNPAILKQQVSRMLRDARSDALINNFFGQWLLLRNVRTRAPDPDAFPDFDENLREALERETELFVESQLREDRSVVDLLRANYTFLNERLARHYGIPNIYGNHFRRVTLRDETRVGLLGQGSILTVTSYPNRTSPTQRGLWVLDHLLGAPPPPPPPDVPSLPEPKPGNAKFLTMRERMDQHRTNAVCASCHASMDPLGFALENFDGIGAWRTFEGNTSIDASGTLPDGSKFEGPAGLRSILLSRQGQFVQTLTEKLLTYALGRGVEYYDAPAVRKIARESAAGDYRWSSVILGIVNSTPFQMRRLQEP
jgi:mono/diheme cytochrome c family protein